MPEQRSSGISNCLAKSNRDVGRSLRYQVITKRPDDVSLGRLPVDYIHARLGSASIALWLEYAVPGLESVERP
jgi:hypothetical protein